MKRIVLTMGGGGFSEEPENPLLDQALFALCGKTKPKVCFIGTASGDAQGYMDKFYENMKKHEVEATHLSLFKPPAGSLRDFVMEKDVFYVGGGNTRNLMVLWREWGLDKFLCEAYQAGKVMGGISAGSLCWYEQGVTDSITGILSPMECTGILPGSNCPHYSAEPERRPNYQRLIKAGMKPGIACDDGVAALWVNEKFVECVSSRPGAKGYKVFLKDGAVVEEALSTRYLGK